MTTAPAVQPVLPFAEFLEELRRQGFVIGLDQHLRLQLLLDQLADSCPPERLKTHLCPIFATSPEEQGRFHRAFDRFYPAFATAGEESEREARRSAATESLMPERREPDGLRRRVLLVLAIAATLAGLGFWWWSARKGEPPPAPAAIDSAAVTPPPIASDTAVAPAPAAADSVAPLPTPAPESEPGRGTFFARHRTAIRYLAVVLPFLLFLFNEWRLYRRRRLVVERQRRQKPPFSWPVRLEAPVNPFTDSEELPTAARHLRQREAGEVERLSVEQSVSATIAALGFPTFRYKTDTRMPEYLLLIEREAHRDHRARLFQSLAHALEKEGVHTTRYFYDGDPRVCDPEDGQHHELLVDIRRRFPGYRLLVFGTGARLVDPLSGRLQPWTTDFLSWSDRALLTPESPSTWGVRELALAQHFVVLPATTQGLLGVVDHFRGPVRPDPRRWQEDDPGPDTPRLDDGDPLPRLRSFLGQKVFRWLCACAVYPELHWDLTLHLGSLPELGPGLITEEHLLRLLRLPWYRQGAIPDEARAQLIDQLTEAEERAVRQAIVELLERNPAPGDSVSANRYELNLVVQRLALGRRDPKQRAEALKELRGFPRRELVQDFAMVRLLEETPSSRLAVILPRRFRRVFYRDGVPAFGMRAGMRAALILLVLGAGWRISVAPPAGDFVPVGPTVSKDGTVLLLVGEKSYLFGVGRDLGPVRFSEVDVVETLSIEPESLARIVQSKVQVDTIRDVTKTRFRVFTYRMDSIVGRAPGLGTLRALTAGGKELHWPIRVESPSLGFANDTVALSVDDIRQLKLVVPTQENRDLPSELSGGLRWTTSDSSVVRARPDGVVEVIGPGAARVTVRRDGHEASIAISVAEPVTGVAVDQRPAVELVLREYARALSAGDLEAMLAVFPGMPAQMRDGYKQMFKRNWVLDTSRWRYLDISVNNGTAQARLGGSSVLRNEKGKPQEESPFRRAASLERDQKGWRIVAIDGSERPSPPGPVATGTDSGPTPWIAGLAELRGLDSLRIRARAGGAAARKAYFAAFDSLLYARTAERVLENIRSFPAVRTDSSDYAWSYGLLKAHLITTSYPEMSTADFLVPVLEGAWSQGRPPLNDERIRLARAQFTFFAEELARGRNPLPDITDSSAVGKARAFLHQFTNREQIYQIMQMEAARSGAQSFDFDRAFPKAGQVLTATFVVPAAFTRQGWRYMQDSAFKMPERYFQGEEWVLGQRPSERERYTIVDSIRNRYRRDYADHWRRVLAEARVAPFANLTDAARKLKVLGSNTSPLMQLINAVSLNTAVDPALASTIFQPALAVSPPDSTRLIAVQTRPYMGALQGLGAALEALEAAGPAEREGQAQDAKEQVAAAKNTARAIEALFARVPNGVGPDITRLLQAGFSSIEDMLGKAGPAVVDQPREAVVASVALTTPVTSLAIGETTTWIAVPRNAGGKELADRAVVWRSSAPLVATVSGDGHVTALTAGTAEITVEVEGISASQRVIVTPAAPAPPRVSGPGAEAQSSYNRALQFEDQNLLAKASDAYREALRAFPEYAEASAGLTRVVVRLRVFDWAKHLERRSLTGLRQMYPDMPAKDQQAWKRLLENPSLTRISVEPRDLAVELTGPEARVRYALVYTMMMRPNGLQTSVNRYAATFKLLRGAWLITAMQGVP